MAAVQKKDTVKLLNDHINARKARFKGQPLNKVLAELNLKVKSYGREVNYLRTQELTYSITLFFCESNTVSNDLIDGKEVPFLIIEFERPIERDKPAFKKGYGMGPWGSDEIAYYGPMIVKEITGLKRVKPRL